MTKTIKRNSVVRKITSIALSTMLLLSMALPTFATTTTSTEPIIPGAIKGGVFNKPVEAAITKILQMPAGTETPNLEFEFSVVKATDVGAANNDAPAITGPFTATFSSSNTNKTVKSPPTNVKQLYFETDNIFAGVPWPHAGVFHYYVTENKPSNDLEQLGYINKGDKKIDDILIYSEAKYLLNVYVKSEIVAGETKYYVYAVGAVIIDQDDSHDAADVGTKVDPTPGGNGTGESKVDFSQMIFTNTYVRNNGSAVTDPEDPEDPEDIDPEEVDAATVLRIEKKVTGDFGDKTKPFLFDLQVKNPEVGGLAEGKKYLVYKMGKDEMDALKIYDYKVITEGEHSVYLTISHGQWLAFIDLPVGAGFISIEERTTQVEPDDYDTTIRYHKAGVDLEPIKGKTIGELVGENPSIVEYENEYTAVIAPTGISVDNLPYVILIALAAFALVGYALSKTRMNARVSL